MNQFTPEALQEALNPLKMIETTEKNLQAAVAYVEPRELGATLATLITAQADYARSTLEALKSIATISKTVAADTAKQFTKAAK